MGTEGRQYFHEKVLRGGVGKGCFWENFDNQEKRRIYRVNGFCPCEIEEGERLKYSISYMDDMEQSRKTPEETAFDLEATPGDLINLGKRLG